MATHFDGVFPLFPPFGHRVRLPDEVLLGQPERPEPQSVAAEQHLLGAILVNNRAYDSVADYLRPEHFYDPVHQLIFAAMGRLIDEGTKADPLTLQPLLERDERLIAAGGMSYLAKLVTAMVAILGAGQYGRLIHENWQRRQLIDLSKVAIDLALLPTDKIRSPAEILDIVDSGLTGIFTQAVQGDVADAKSATLQAIVRAAEAEKRGGEVAGIPSGLKRLDRVIGGFLPGQVVLLGARTSVGKSALALTIAARVAAAGYRVGFWSGEMPAFQIGSRLLSAYTGIPTSSVFAGRNWYRDDSVQQASSPFTKRQWDALHAASCETEKLPLKFNCESGMTVARLRRWAQQLKRKSGLDFLVVDYLGLLRASPGMEQRSAYERMSDISRSLMDLKSELNVPILALSQLSRSGDSTEDKLPMLGSLRDSGALEQDANVVMLLHRAHYHISKAVPQRKPNESQPDFFDRQQQWVAQCAETQGKAVVIVAKNRNGPTRDVDLSFGDDVMWFRDLDEGPFSPAWSSR